MSFAQGASSQPLVLQGSNVFLYGSSTSGNAFTIQQLSAGNVFSAQTSTGATSLIINPSGFVGIGTTNPGYILDVNGSARIATNTLTLPTVLATTSIGIGTTATPPNKLSVLSTTAQLASAVQISHPVGDWGLVIKRAVNDVGTSNFAFLKSRGEASTIITQGDGIGRIAWHAVTNATGPVIQHLAEISVFNTTFTGGNADGAILFWTKQTTDANPVERMRILPSGFVGIGTATPAFRHHVYNGDASMSYYGPNATWSSYLKVGAGNTYSSSTNASVVCSNGNLHIDCANGAYNMYLNYFQGGGSGGTNATVGCYAAFTATGDITAFSSDERLKTKVGLIENPLDKVCSLTAFKYIHNETARQNGFTDDNVYVGLSAQEVQKVLPEVVKPAPFDQGTEYDVGKGKSKSGQNFLTIQYERIVSLLVEALKEERAERLKVDESLRTTNERLARLEKLLLKE